jgi:predicted ATPase/DNA-binding SARP family transcriptional activator
MEIRILGPLEVADGDRLAPLGGAKQRALLAVLLMHLNEVVTTDRLIEEVWAGTAPATATKSVQVYVSALRRSLPAPEPVLFTRPGGYVLQLDPAVVDACRFEQAVEAGRRAMDDDRPERAAETLRAGLALWRGPPLVDFTYQPFAQAEIARLEDMRVGALEQLVEVRLALGRHADVVGELESLIAGNPFRERLRAQLMLALYRCDRQAEALQAYQDARTALVEELGIEPGPRLRELHQAILAHDPVLDVTAPKRPSAPTPRASQLPTPLTALFGREADLDRLADLVGESRTRLLVLLGPGGVGKTRLAIAVTRRLARDFAEVGFVALAGLSDPGDLASGIAVALGAPLREGEPARAALLRFLADRHLLLVLDNFEHLLAGAPLVAELLEACPRLTILVTSRAPMRLAAERLYPVRPLEAPAERLVVPMADLERYAAVALFCDRARGREPDFAIDANSAPHVCAICRRLDGLPLALELAAARVALLPPAELAARLDKTLAVLGAGPGDAPARQRTLRATIDWSYNLLTADERRAFARFAVFASGATVAAAETVTCAALDTLDSLVAKQLLIRRHRRLLMLETVREYALERLAHEPDANAVHERLANWALTAVGAATPHLVREDRVTYLNALEAELPNLTTALSWALDNRPADLAMRLVVALGEYWWRGSRWQDGLPWLDAALERGSAAAPEPRAWTLLYRARLTGIRRYERYRTDMQAALELFRACDHAPGIAACLGHTAVIEAWIGRFEQAAMAGDEAVNIAKRVQDNAAIAVALTERVAAAARYEDAACHARRAVTALQRAGNLFDLAIVCSLAGYIAIGDRRYREALRWLDDAVQAARRLQNPRSVLGSRGNQGLARLFLDDLDGAEEAFSDALAGYRDAVGEDLVAHTILGQAAVAARRGNIARAAQLAGAARHQARGTTPARHEQAIWARLDSEILASARAASDREAWDQSARQGASLTPAEAVAVARRRS